MPDIPDRQQTEAELAAAILVVFVAYEERMLQLLGDPPNARAIGAGFYDALAVDIQRAVTPTLTRVYREGAGRAVGQLSGAAVGGVAVLIDEGALARQLAAAEAESARWAAEQGKKIAADLARRMREEVNAAARTAVVTGATMAEESDVIFSSESIASTEVTRANTAGERNVAERISDEFGRPAGRSVGQGISRGPPGSAPELPVQFGISNRGRALRIQRELKTWQLA